MQLVYFLYFNIIKHVKKAFKKKQSDKVYTKTNNILGIASH